MVQRVHGVAARLTGGYPSDFVFGVEQLCDLLVSIVTSVSQLGRETGRGPLARVDRRTLGSSTRAALLWNSPQGPPSEERRTDAAENKEEKETLMGVTILSAHGALHMGHYV